MGRPAAGGQTASTKAEMCAEGRVLLDGKLPVCLCSAVGGLPGAAVASSEACLLSCLNRRQGGPWLHPQPLMDKRAPLHLNVRAKCGSCPAPLLPEGKEVAHISPESELVHTSVHISGLVLLGLGVADGHADTADGGMTDPVQSPVH